MALFRILIAGSDRVLCHLLEANLHDINREIVYVDPLLYKPCAWAKADVIIMDVGNYSPEQASLYRICQEGCSRSGGSLLLLYEPPWPAVSLTKFGAIKEFPKPVSLSDVARSVSQFYIQV